MHSNTRGFTLVELIIVLLIIGILAMAGMAGFGSWFAKGRVDGAIDQLFTEIQNTRMRAIAENNKYSVSFNAVSHSYSILDKNDTVVKTVVINDSFKDITFDFVAGTKDTENVAALATSPKDPVTFASDKLTFLSTGLSNEGSVFLLPLNETRMDLQRAVSVNSVGRVKRFKHNGSAWE